VGVQLIGLRRTSIGAQALVRTEEADVLGGDVLVGAPTLEEIAIHIGARVPRRNLDSGAEPFSGAGRREFDSSMSTGRIA
jgi:hypothetical protein